MTRESGVLGRSWKVGGDLESMVMSYWLSGSQQRVLRQWCLNEWMDGWMAGSMVNTHISLKSSQSQVSEFREEKQSWR